MKEITKPQVDRDQILSAIVAALALAWGLSKFAEPSIGNIASGIGWLIFASSVALHTAASMRNINNEFAWKCLTYARYTGLTIVFVAIFLPKQ